MASRQDWKARAVLYWSSPLGIAEAAHRDAARATAEATLRACQAQANASRAATAFLRAAQAHPEWQAERVKLAEWQAHNAGTNAGH